jgi:hypothetical protein
LEGKQRLGVNNDETTFRSPTPGPDFSTIHRDSITLEELIDRLTPTSTSTPEVIDLEQLNFRKQNISFIEIIVFDLDYISLSSSSMFSNTYQPNIIIQ